ncbi:hypothetical protein GCM10022243_02810 [Saccharothrix violaceirubra]|uniref:Uncharacterized protein n=1 Tax=Saccharothrix violaceirubra TaxID=413306 RepID=A0A7W7T0H3_9PSEU|nr:hypothetical protein [Saccharothrix violaceirubra]MBB4964031.1 hypothetical protein [Saccharothrix violaceirubra]
MWRSEVGSLDAMMGAPPRPSPPARQGWLVKAAGLLAIAVVSGLVWVVVFAPDDEPEGPLPVPGQSASAKNAKFQPSPQVPEPLKDSDCAPHAYGKTKEFLTATRCRQLTRQLFTSTTTDGRTVYTSVSVVRMASADDAAKLRDLTTKDGTGNVNDLVKDGAVTVPGLRTLASGGYASEQQDSDVVIVESDSVDRNPDTSAHNAEMKRVSTEALGLAASLTD